MSGFLGPCTPDPFEHGCLSATHFAKQGLWLGYMVDLRLEYQRRHPALLNVVLGKQILWLGHVLELKIVSRRILEEARPLFARCPLKPENGLNDERDACILDALDDLVPELFCRHLEAKMGHWHLVTIDWVEEIGATIVMADPVHDELVPVNRVVLPLCRGPPLLAAKDAAVKVLRHIQIVHRDCQVKRYTWSRLGPNLKLACCRSCA